MRSKVAKSFNNFLVRLIAHDTEIPIPNNQNARYPVALHAAKESDREYNWNGSARVFVIMVITRKHPPS
jgi:hypothetical protein